MAARAIWKGVINISEVRLPVKLYSAVEDRNIHFNLLHDQDLVRVKQRLAHSKTGETVSYQEAKRGVELSSDKIVMIEDEELEGLTPEASRDIEVERFVPRGEISHQHFDRPYYLGPDDSETDYFALAKALAQANQEGLAYWTMRKKQYVGALVERGGYLMLITLRHEAEVIESSELSSPEGRELEEKEKKLAKQLIQALTDEFDPSEYHDTYRERVAELIAAKERGETLEVETYEEKPESDSLSESLEASIKAAAAH